MDKILTSNHVYFIFRSLDKTLWCVSQHLACDIDTDRDDDDKDERYFHYENNYYIYAKKKKIKAVKVENFQLPKKKKYVFLF